jgi:hypothetical protein
LTKADDFPYYGDQIRVIKSPAGAVYNSDNSRAEIPTLTFSFTSSVLTGLASGNHTVTHVVFIAETEGSVIAVGEESPARIITSSSSFSYTLNLWGKFAI